MAIRTRFAPSPTGYLHIGGVRTALFNWLLAKQSGGQFILRIDDTDQQRNVEAALQPILEGFRWLGLTWDEGPDVGGPHAPYFQSQRSDRYQAAVEKLLASGAAYRDYARAEELQEQRTAAEKSGATYIYDRRWMAESDDAAAAFEAEGRVGVVRLKIPREGKCQFNDIIRGPVEFDWAAEQDHVIQRTDGTCLYHLASVVDDYDYQITHVVRAVEHLPNTPRQIFIAQSLGYPLPIYAHLPYVAEPNGTAKLSKRKLDKYLKQKDFAELFNVGQKIAGRLNRETTPETFNPVVVDFYREIGFLPDAILNYLILLGWSLDDKTEHFTKEDMIQHFSLERVNKAPASFDPQKLIAFQTRWMNNLSVDEKVEMVLPYLKSAQLISESPSTETLDRVQQVVKAASDRIKMAGDILQFDDFFVADTDLNYDTELCSKRITNDAAAVELLKAFRGLLEPSASFDAASTEQLCKSMLEERGAKIGQIIHALRASVTGKASGFAMFDTLAILGKTQCLNRIDQAIARFAS